MLSELTLTSWDNDTLKLQFQKGRRRPLEIKARGRTEAAYKVVPQVRLELTIDDLRSIHEWAGSLLNECD